MAVLAGTRCRIGASYPHTHEHDGRPDVHVTGRRPYVLIVDAAIFGIALVCTVRPDSHVGLLVVLAVGVDWLATVHDRATPWSVGAAASLAVFHASMAAASVAPPAARWTRAMCRRWTRRSFAVMVASLGTWAVVAAVHGRHIASSAVLIAASLIIIAIAGLWARGGTLDAEPGA